MVFLYISIENTLKFIIINTFLIKMPRKSNPNPNKIVVAPEWYHPDEPTLKREKFYPKEYILK